MLTNGRADLIFADMNRVKELREARGLRREDLASRSSVSYEYVRRIEANLVESPSLPIARQIAEALGATVDEVFPPPVEAPEPAPAEAAQ